MLEVLHANLIGLGHQGYNQRGKSGSTTAKAATTKMDRRTQIGQKRNPAEETGME